MTNKVTLMALADMPQQRGVHCRAHGLDLALFRVGDEVFAIADSCPHQGASLANGKLQGYAVACPAHGLKFDVRTGCSLASADLRNKSYPVRVIDAAIALKLGSVEDWLRWIDAHASVEGAVDEGDAEDVCVYLAAFVHKLPVAAFGSLFLHQGLPIDGDASVAFEALANTARHFGWALVLCTQDSGTVPEGFGLVAAPEPQGDQGWWADARLWSEGAEGTPAKSARFVVGAIPANAPPEPVLAALVQLRCTRV